MNDDDRRWAEDRLSRPSRAPADNLERLREWMTSMGLLTPVAMPPEVPEVPHPIYGFTFPDEPDPVEARRAVEPLDVDRRDASIPMRSAG